MQLNDGRSSLPFGMRRRPVYGERRFHAGVDPTAPAGPPISTCAPVLRKM
ncbi:MAG TPA: hypothetical protein VN289_15460 [Paraburkholderia sp.]|jgi:murein DD-endopeptidase MepM/ murein hydrolase activator NlpD|nr:hypothetical protein [Paraburkholderia sp.]